MNLNTWNIPWSSLFKRKAVEDCASTPGETPELYLKLALQCLEQTDRISSSRKFNEEQCKYLVDKLRLAIMSTRSVFEQIQKEFLSIPEDKASLLEIFKLLCSMGKEVEGFNQSCCEDSWIQSAIMLTNMSEHVASIGFNLEFCMVMFSARKLGKTRSLRLSEVASVRQAQAEIVKEMANLDEMNLIMDLSTITQSKGSSSADYQMASFLLERLEMVRFRPGATWPTSNNKSHLQMNLSLKTTQVSLGKGASASVHKAKWLGVEVAKKTFYGPKNGDFFQEVSILEGLSHPNIVCLLWYTTDEKRCHLVMELMDGDLHSLMQERMEENGDQSPPFCFPEALDLILQVGEGMSFLHEKRVVHRDLKSHNILIKYGQATKANMKSLHVKVADFGLSKTKEHSAYSNMTLNVGTTRWMAPEVMKIANDDDSARKLELKYPFKSDVYSFAMVCYEILTGDVPFSALSVMSEVKSLVLRGGRPQLPPECPDRLRTLIKACWSAEAITRPSFGDICEELRNVKYGSLMAYWVGEKFPLSREDIAAISQLAANLSSPSAEVQRGAAYAISLLLEKNDDHRISIAEQGVIPLLVALILSPDQKTQEYVVRILLSLSVVDSIKGQIISSGAVESISQGLRSGCMVVRHEALELLFILESVGVNMISIGKSGATSEGLACSPDDKAAIDELIAKLSSPMAEVQRSAAYEIRLRTIKNVDRRIYIAEQGAISLLVVLLLSPDQKTQEHAVTSLLNLSINDSNKERIVAAGAIEPVVEVLRSGRMVARENAAATLFSLSVVDENKITIGNSGAIPALVQLLHDGTARGKKDAATALFNLSIYPGNKARAVQAGVVLPLMSLLSELAATMLNEALALLTILASDPEGLIAVGKVGRTSILVRIIASESARNKENAAAILLALCSHYPGYIKQVRESNAVEPLMVLARSRDSTNRAKRKGSALLELLKKSDVESVSHRLKAMQM